MHEALAMATKQMLCPVLLWVWLQLDPKTQW